MIINAILPSKQFNDPFGEGLCVIFTGDVSSRTIALISEKQIGREISVSEELGDLEEALRERNLSGDSIKYIFFNTTHFCMRIDGFVEKVPVLIAVGASDNKHLSDLGLEDGDREFIFALRKIFRDLNR